jgi:hypothetical protein
LSSPTSRLESLDLSHNALTDTTGLALCTSLSSNTTLHTLTLSFNLLRASSGEALASLTFSANTSLRCLNLRYNLLRHEHLRQVAENLERNARGGGGVVAGGKTRVEVGEERVRRRGEQGRVECEQRRMVEAEVKERQGAERLRREVEEERERDTLRGLIEEADRLERVKEGMD